MIIGVITLWLNDFILVYILEWLHRHELVLVAQLKLGVAFMKYSQLWVIRFSDIFFVL